ncbi:MAG: cell division protein FtsA [Candidatus Electryoneaceae bacterium]|nr:cell division protein FtsA [Candidatus Electryoneaceae bacterium]
MGIRKFFQKEEHKEDIEKPIVVIDLGNNKVVAVIAERTINGNVQVVGVGYEAFPFVHLRQHDVMVDDIAKATRGIRSAVSKASQMADIYDIQEAYVGISGSCISLMPSHGVTSVSRSQDKTVSIISEDDVDRLLTNARDRNTLQNTHVLHILPYEYIIDGRGNIRENRSAEQDGILNVKLTSS